jgi:hypothetical protein
MATDTFSVLAVEDDRVCCKVLERKLKYYNYNGVCSCPLVVAIFPDYVVI